MDKSVAIYSEIFLSISMTFIYRQLKYRGEYPKVVSTKKIEFPDIYPYDKVFQIDYKKSYAEKIIDKLHHKVLKNKFVHSHKKEEDYWLNAFRRNNVALIHAHFGPGGMQMLPLKKKLNIPLITTFHGYDLSKLLNDKAYLNQLAVLLSEGDLNIAVSEYFRKKLISLGCDPKKVITHYIGIPVNDYKFKNREIKGDKVRLVQVSNFVKKKGHVYLLEALKNVLQTKKNVELVLVGDGPERGEIENKIKELGISDNVMLLGKLRSELSLKEADKSDIFIHHSITDCYGDTEGIPTAIMEAMSLGLPVITTYHTGIPELVKNYETGLLNEEKDVDGLAENIIRLIDDSELYSKINLNARCVIEKDFNIDVQNKKLEDIYSSLIK
jgi:glycosyltransferase involved in cell wall biosynthesis